MELIEALFIQPYCRINQVAQTCNITEETASVHLKKLVEVGLLEEKLYGRNKIFINKEYFNLLKQK